MLWFKTPEKVYIKSNCLPTALEELKNERFKRITVFYDNKVEVLSKVNQTVEHNGLHVENDSLVISAVIATEGVTKISAIKSAKDKIVQGVHK